MAISYQQVHLTSKVLLCGFFMAGTALSAPKRSWTNNEAMLVLFEVLQTIESKSIAQIPLDDNVQVCIQESLKRIDPYCSYLSAEDYTSYQESQQNNYSGIGVELQMSDIGKVLLRPYQDSPASNAGIETGDELIAIEQDSVAGLSITEITRKIRGEPGTRIRLFIRKADGMVRSPVLTRAPAQARSVEMGNWKGFETIRIYQFTPTTPEELKNCLQSWDPMQPMLIDLRGNGGGDLLRAVDCAAMFLPKETLIVRISKPESQEDHLALSEGNFQSLPLYLLQDEQTASAAEVFIAALLQNPEVTAWGQRSFGKGITQQIFPMSNGGALILTNAILKRKDGSTWNKKGIEPEGSLEALLSFLSSNWPLKLN